MSRLPARFAVAWLEHAQSCQCFLCRCDLTAQERAVEAERADAEEDGDTDADIEWNRARGMERAA